VHQEHYRIAGVIRDFDGLLSKTDIWIPISSRSPLARLASMKILGTLHENSDWDAAQKKLTYLFKQPLIEPAYIEAKGAKLLPIARGIKFAESAGIAARNNSPEKTLLIKG
jgi:hypothetical protein